MAVVNLYIKIFSYDVSTRASLLLAFCRCPQKKQKKKKPLTKAFPLCKTMQSRSVSIDTTIKWSASGEHERNSHVLWLRIKWLLWFPSVSGSDYSNCWNECERRAGVVFHSRWMKQEKYKNQLNKWNPKSMMWRNRQWFSPLGDHYRLEQRNQGEGSLQTTKSSRGKNTTYNNS